MRAITNPLEQAMAKTINLCGRVFNLRIIRNKGSHKKKIKDASFGKLKGSWVLVSNLNEIKVTHKMQM